MDKYWKFTFERFCFAFQPAIRESVDVVFKTKLPLEGNEHIFEDKAWKALEKQYPSWIEDRDGTNFVLNVSGKKFGKSSALFEKRFKFTEVKRVR